MSIWQIQINDIAAWNCPDRRYDPDKYKWDIQGGPKCIWHYWWQFYCRIKWGWYRPWQIIKQITSLCRKENLKLYKIKWHFRCTHFLEKNISRYGIQADPHKLHTLTGMSSPKVKKELQSFLGIRNYLSKHSPPK